MEKFHRIPNILPDPVVDPQSINFETTRLIKNAADKIIQAPFRRITLQVRKNQPRHRSLQLDQDKKVPTPGSLRQRRFQRSIQGLRCRINERSCMQDTRVPFQLEQ